MVQPKVSSGGLRISCPQGGISGTSGFDSLALALEDWFDTQLADLPDALRKRVVQEFFPMPWDNLSADQRRSVALQLDYQHDPAMESDRQDLSLIHI